MKKSRYSDSQILAIIKQAESAVPIPELCSDNGLITDWLVRLTHNQRNWGFGLCYLYLRNVKGFKWNHKCVYRIYRELELNLRIKPKKRLVMEKPEQALMEHINRILN
jgi:putative transposase